MNRLIVEIVDLGVPVTIEKDEKYGVRYNLNTEMKSHCYLVEDEVGFKALMRYDCEERVYTLEDVLYKVKSCMLGRDFLSSQWEEALLENGILKKIVKTAVTYK